MAIKLQFVSDSRQAQADIAQMNRGVKALDTNVAKTSQTMSGLAKTVQIAAGAFAALYSLKSLTRVADQFTNISNRIALITGRTSELNETFVLLQKLATKTSSSLSGTASLFTKISQSTEKMGTSQQDVLTVVENIQKAVAISGASADEANAALVQLGQGMAAGALRGEELNSVMEQTPRVAKAIADALGVGIGELRGMAAQGAITSDVIVKAFTTGAQSITEEFSVMEKTFGQAFVVFNDSFSFAISQFIKGTGVVPVLTRKIGELSQKFQNSGEFALKLGEAVAVPFKKISSAVSRLKVTFDSVISLMLAFKREAADVFATIDQSGLVRFGVSVKNLFKSFTDDSLWSGLKGNVTNLVSYLSDAFKSLKIKDLSGFTHQLDLARISLVNIMKTLASFSLKSLSGLFTSIGKSFNDSLVLSKVKSFTERVITYFKGVYYDVIGRGYWTDTISHIRKSLRDLDFSKLSSGLTISFSKITSSIRSFGKDARAELKSLAIEAFLALSFENKFDLTAIYAGFKLILNGSIAAGFKLIGSAAKDLFLNLLEYTRITAIFEKIRSTLSNVFSGVNKTTSPLAGALDSVRDFSKRVIGSFAHIYDKVIGNSYWTDLVKEVIKGAVKVRDQVPDILSDFANQVKETFSNLKERVNEALASTGSLVLKLAIVLNIDESKLQSGSILVVLSDIFSKPITESLNYIREEYPKVFRIVGALFTGYLLSAFNSPLWLKTLALTGALLVAGIDVQKVLDVFAAVAPLITEQIGLAVGAGLRTLLNPANWVKLAVLVWNAAEAFGQGVISQIPLIGNALNGLLKYVPGGSATAGLLATFIFGQGGFALFRSRADGGIGIIRTIYGHLRDTMSFFTLSSSRADIKTGLMYLIFGDAGLYAIPAALARVKQAFFGAGRALTIFNALSGTGIGFWQKLSIAIPSCAGAITWLTTTYAALSLAVSTNWARLVGWTVIVDGATVSVWSLNGALGVLNLALGRIAATAAAGSIANGLIAAFGWLGRAAAFAATKLNWVGWIITAIVAAFAIFGSSTANAGEAADDLGDKSLGLSNGLDKVGVSAANATIKIGKYSDGLRGVAERLKLLDNPKIKVPFREGTTREEFLGRDQGLSKVRRQKGDNYKLADPAKEEPNAYGKLANNFVGNFIPDTPLTKGSKREFKVEMEDVLAKDKQFWAKWRNNVRAIFSDSLDEFEQIPPSAFDAWYKEANGFTPQMLKELKLDQFQADVLNNLQDTIEEGQKKLKHQKSWFFTLLYGDLEDKKVKQQVDKAVKEANRVASMLIKRQAGAKQFTTDSTSLKNAVATTKNDGGFRAASKDSEAFTASLSKEQFTKYNSYTQSLVQLREEIKTTGDFAKRNELISEMERIGDAMDDLGKASGRMVEVINSAGKTVKRYVQDLSAKESVPGIQGKDFVNASPAKFAQYTQFSAEGAQLRGNIDQAKENQQAVSGSSNRAAIDKAAIEVLLAEEVYEKWSKATTDAMNLAGIVSFAEAITGLPDALALSLSEKQLKELEKNELILNNLNKLFDSLKTEEQKGSRGEGIQRKILAAQVKRDDYRSQVSFVKTPEALSADELSRASSALKDQFFDYADALAEGQRRQQEQMSKGTQAGADAAAQIALEMDGIAQRLGFVKEAISKNFTSNELFSKLPEDVQARGTDKQVDSLLVFLKGIADKEEEIALNGGNDASPKLKKELIDLNKQYNNRLAEVKATLAQISFDQLNAGLSATARLLGDPAFLAATRELNKDLFSLENQIGAIPPGQEAEPQYQYLFLQKDEKTKTRDKSAERTENSATVLNKRDLEAAVPNAVRIASSELSERIKDLTQKKFDAQKEVNDFGEDGASPAALRKLALAEKALSDASEQAAIAVRKIDLTALTSGMSDAIKAFADPAQFKDLTDQKYKIEALAKAIQIGGVTSEVSEDQIRKLAELQLVYNKSLAATEAAVKKITLDDLTTGMSDYLKTVVSEEQIGKLRASKEALEDLNVQRLKEIVDGDVQLETLRALAQAQENHTSTLKELEIRYKKLSNIDLLSGLSDYSKSIADKSAIDRTIAAKTKLDTINNEIFLAELHGKTASIALIQKQAAAQEEYSKFIEDTNTQLELTKDQFKEVADGFGAAFAESIYSANFDEFGKNFVQVILDNMQNALAEQVSAFAEGFLQGILGAMGDTSESTEKITSQIFKGTVGPDALGWIKDKAESIFGGSKVDPKGTGPITGLPNLNAVQSEGVNAVPLDVTRGSGVSGETAGSGILGDTSKVICAQCCDSGVGGVKAGAEEQTVAIQENTAATKQNAQIGLGVGVGMTALGTVIGGKTGQVLQVVGLLVTTISGLILAMQAQATANAVSSAAGVAVATGGLISGPGTPTSDSINARLSTGEFVVRAASTAKNLGALQFINQTGQLPGYAEGGLYGSQEVAYSSSFGSRDKQRSETSGQSKTTNITFATEGDFDSRSQRAVRAMINSGILQASLNSAEIENGGSGRIFRTP